VAKFTTSIVLEADLASIERARAELVSIPNGISRAVQGAVNKTLEKGRTLVKVRLFEILAVKKQSVIAKTPSGADRIKVLPYGQESSDGGTLRILTREIGLINFEHRILPNGGIIFHLYRDGAGETDEDRSVRYFRGVGLSNNRHIFYRNIAAPKFKVLDAHYKKNIGKVRQRVHVAKGVSLLIVFRSRPTIGTEVLALFKREFPIQLDSQVDRLLKRPKAERTSS
jgi:hypothetical protein